ncbi:RDD family protein [Pseudomarimonas arenosa]|uniref:RDD family protein n=1 Tax=Pseudomarimonas arenosa TaxID=2774145 RepID=A0AAW3ZI34_9GAMM|nr:RDD family protein [Pseudomarimonas arenosa]MBD8525658.1 RDD family protein [Pseudomarimonas arenosa]
MSDDIYAAPKASLELADGTEELASRWARLGASIIDTLILLVVVIPLQWASGVFDYVMRGEQPPMLYSIGFLLLGLVVFALLHGKFLLSDGQTIGKKVLSIKIVDTAGQVPVLPTYLKRYGVYFLPGNIPIIGGILSLINILFIFGEKRTCVHDIVAGTRVVVAR